MHLCNLSIVLIITSMALISFSADSYALESCESLAKVGDRVGIKYQITNNVQEKSTYVSILQIKNVEGITMKLSWLNGMLESKQQFEVVHSWIPEETGEYTVEVFMWDRVDRPQALSTVKTLTINVDC